MKQFGVGHYKVKSGARAVVVQCVPVPHMGWALRGAIECPHTNALALMLWDIHGKALNVAQGFTESDLDQKASGLTQCG